MAKGYWIGRIDVSDPEAYQHYIRANAEPFAKYGGRFLVRGGSHEVVEGSGRERNISSSLKVTRLHWIATILSNTNRPKR